MVAILVIVFLFFAVPSIIYFLFMVPWAIHEVHKEEKRDHPEKYPKGYTNGNF